ncbi:MAG: sodium:solute symporter family protein [Deltaproteobacteria bacterium]
MNLAALDWVIIAAYLVLTLAIGLGLTRRASEHVDDFFLAGRKLPWWMVGTSMVATTLAADTPLGVTELVRTGGVAGAWYGWSAAVGIVTVAIFFSRLWRRSGVVTDAELVELRYDGRPASALRVMRSVYLSLVVNTLTLGWVILAMVRIVEEVMGLPQLIILPILLIIAVGYSTASGFWGVVATDALQFGVAMTGTIALAVFAVMDAGGPSGLTAALGERGALDLVPSADSELLPPLTFGVYVGMQWWATRNADGGEYLGQRVLAAKDPRHAQLGMLWYAVGEFVIKLWPIILVAASSLVLYPHLDDPQSAYPKVIAEHLPIGLRGLLVAALLAAFMSTVDTQLNWASSYLVNDLYRRFYRPNASMKHYVRLSRVAMIALALFGTAVSLVLSSVADAWKLLVALGAGQGLVVLLRWYWWRINAWSEITAMIASAVTTLIVHVAWPGDEHYGARLATIAGVSTVCWVAATFATRPVALSHLCHFYARVRPDGGAWGPVQRALGIVVRPRRVRSIVSWLLGLGFVYGLTFGVGAVILHDALYGALALAAGVLCGVALWFQLAATYEDEDLAAEEVPSA